MARAHGRMDRPAVSIPDQWRYLSCNMDLTGCASIEAAATRIEQALRSGDHERAIWQITLTGLPGFDLDVAALAEQVKTKAHVQYGLRLALPYDLEQLAKERTVRGLLAQRFQAQLTAVHSDQERRMVLYALNAALQALAGKRELPYEVG
jgi:hypothetical protein